MAAELDIEVPRNGDYFAGWWFQDRNTEEPLDTTGWTYALQIRAAAGGGGPPIASATFSGRDDVAGFVNVKIDGSDFSAVDGETEIVRLAYDFVATDADGNSTVQSRGQIILMPGVTI